MQIEYATLRTDLGQGILILCRHSFDGNSLITGREALKCLANIMLLEEPTRQIFVDLGYAAKAAECLKVSHTS